MRSIPWRTPPSDLRYWTRSRPQELYYLIVLSEDEIYTSSYLGVYDRIFQRMQAPMATAC